MQGLTNVKFKKKKSVLTVWNVKMSEQYLTV